MALAALQTQEVYQHLVNKYCPIGEYFQAYQQIHNDNETSLRSFTMIMNNIVTMGFVEEKIFELFKRKKWKNKSYITEYYFNSTLRRSPRQTSNHHEIVNSTVSTEATSVNIGNMEIPCKQNKQDKQQTTRNNKRKRNKTSQLPQLVVPLSTENEDEPVVRADTPTTLPSDNPIRTVTTVTPDRSAITRQSLFTSHSTKSRYNSFDGTAQYYIDASLLLDFAMRPRPNLKLNTTSEFVPILSPNTNKRASENVPCHSMMWYYMSKFLLEPILKKIAHAIPPSCLTSFMK